MTVNNSNVNIVVNFDENQEIERNNTVCRLFESCNELKKCLSPMQMQL